MFYAVNVCDMTCFIKDPRVMLLVPPVMLPEGQEPTQEAVEALEKLSCEGDRFDGMAVRLHCSEERAAAIVGLLRKWGFKRHMLRFYQSKTGQGGWKRV